MNRQGYLQSLAHCPTEAEVLATARQYLAQWQPEELAQIPSSCRPGKVRDAEDVADYALELTRARMASFGAQPLLAEMETFFAHACTRLSHLEAAHHRGSSKPSLTQ